MYRTGLAYYTYSLNYQSPNYSKKVVKNCAGYGKKLQVQMKTDTFDPGDQISFLSILTNFKPACHLGRIYEGVSWCLEHFKNKSTTNSSSSRLYSKSKKFSDKPDGVLSP